jgi:hypothetical protein
MELTAILISCLLLFFGQETKEPKEITSAQLLNSLWTTALQ